VGPHPNKRTIISLARARAAAIASAAPPPNKPLPTPVAIAAKTARQPKRDEALALALADLEWLIRNAGTKFAGQGRSEAYSGQNDAGRSARAFRIGATPAATDGSYEDMCDALLADGDPRDRRRARTKGIANGECELKRIYDKARKGKQNRRTQGPPVLNNHRGPPRTRSQ
jgi:hypothetical protein